MPISMSDFITRIHASPGQVVLAVTGGGSGAIPAILQVAGASRTILEAMVPYAAAALATLLGGTPDQACSAPTARAMAMAAYLRACRYGAAGPMAGVGCTASLASDRPKRGPHRVHVALQTAATTTIWSLELAKGQRRRDEEEELASRLVVNAVAAACGLDDRLDLPLVGGEHVALRSITASEPWRDLLSGRLDKVRQGGVADASASRVIFPGAFNPLHAGHRRMAEIAAEMVTAAVEFEISILNVDKPPLDYLEIDRRAAQFGNHPLWLTRAATFLEKSALFPGATFAVGVDTIRRLANPKYYGGSDAACRAALEQIVARGCRFLVFGRAQEGQYVGLSQIELPEPLYSASCEVPGERFREDISSTELRRQWES